MLQQLVNGVMLGSVYALVAMSFTLVLGVLGVLNIAITEMFTLGAYLTLWAVAAGIPVAGAAVLGVAGAGVVSVVVERIACRPLKDAPLVMPLLATVGLGIFLQNVVVNLKGSDPVPFPHIPPFEIALPQLLVTGPQLLSLSITAAMLILLILFVFRSRFGRAVRAVAENPQWASLLGVNANRTVSVSFLISGIFAGTAGVLVGLQYGAINPYVGMDIALKGVAVMVVGGVGNLWGAILAGLVFGLAEVSATAQLGASYRDMVAYGLLFLILIIRPQGLLGSAIREGRRA